MLEIVMSNRFKRDLKLAARRGYNFELLDEVVNKLARRELLPEKNRDHALSGDYAGCRECHIAPDWLLVYQTEDKELILYLMRTGTHSDLF